MANPDKDVKIRIDTEADTKGAEKEVKAIEKVTEATEKLSEEESARQKRKEEFEKRRATPGYSDPINPMTDGSQLRATKQQTEAIEEQAEAVEDLAFKVKELSQAEQDALKAQQDADKERAEAMKRAREDLKQQGELEKIVSHQRAQTAIEFGQAIGRASAFVRSFATDLEAANVKGAKLVGGLATGMEAVSSAAQGAAGGFSVAGPLGAAIGGLAGLLSGGLKNAISDTIGQFKALKIAQDNAKVATDNLKRAQEQASLDRRRNTLVEWFQRGAEAIDAATAALERFKQRQDLLAQADIAERQAAAARSPATGADGGALDAIKAETQDRLTALEREVQYAQQQADLASSKAAEFNNQLAIAKSNDASTSADVAAAQERAASAEAAAREAQANADAAVSNSAIQLRTILAEQDIKIEQAFTSISQEQRADVTGMAEQAIQEIEAISTEKGGEISARAKNVLERLYQTVRDNIPDEQQADDLKNLMLLYRDTVEGREREMYATFTALLDGFREAASNYQSLSREVAELRAQMKAVPRPR